MNQSLLSNPWVIALVGGVLSGLVVFLVTRFVLSKRENREYVQKVASANREILYAIRPGISEKVFPSEEVLRSLLVATARKYIVDQSDLWEPHELAQELVKEVMDSSFLSANDKADYCEGLSKMGIREAKPTSPELVAEIRQEVRSTEFTAYRARLTRLVSLMMALLAGLMTALIPLLDFTTDSEARDKLVVLLPGLLSIMVVVMSAGAAVIMRELRRRERDRKERQEDDGDSKQAQSRVTAHNQAPAPDGSRRR